MKVAVLDIETEETLAEWTLFRGVLPAPGDAIVLKSDERPFIVEMRVWRDELTRVTLCGRKAKP